MSYNLHPLFVHFPIALLFVYSIIKILPFKKWFPRVAWKQIEIALLVVGVLGAAAALWTGDTAKELTHPDRDLVEMHSLFADISTWVYGALLLGEILALASLLINKIEKYSKFHSLVIFVKKFLTNKFVSTILALVGLFAISITGVLGGVMVYGTSADPIAGTVLNLLGLQK